MRASASIWREMRVSLPLFASLVLLLATLWLLDLGELWAELSTLDPCWVALAALVVLPQLSLCALRWRFTAGRLGIALPFGRALREYYLSSWLNQVLPTGIGGDALRVLRHGRAARAQGEASPGVRRALLAVVIERASGQLALALCVLGTLPLWFGARGARGFLLSSLGVGALALAGLSITRLPRVPPWLLAVRDALLSRAALPVQFVLSGGVLLTLLLQYYCAVRALDVALPPSTLLRIAPLVLASMALPISFAGWGVREAASAALFSLAGLSAEQGTAISVCYGLLALLGSSPALVLGGGRA